jgi:prophage DNA circulation protein
MTGEEANEALAIIRRIGPVVLTAAVNLNGDIGTALRRAVGMLVVDRSLTDPQVFSFAFSVCVDLARHCDATLVTMDRVRKAALAETPVGLPATQIVLAIIRLTLASEARILAYMAFRSRDEVDAIAVQLHAAFAETAEAAADDLDVATYSAITRLHGDVTQHLADRGRQLPRVISYAYQAVMPSLRMAQRAYADPTRYQELIAENQVVHPAFMPRDGIMLAV